MGSRLKVQAPVHALPWGVSDGRPLVVAHRGGADLWPENSLAAFESALAFGFRDFEIDVHGTREGKLVVVHDATVDRTTDGRGRIRDFSLEELRRFKLVGTDGEPVPLLADVLSLFKKSGARAIVEVKFAGDLPEHDDLCRALVSEITRAGMADEVTISAFHWESLATLRAVSPTIGITAVVSARGVSSRGGIEAVAADAAALGAEDLALEWTAATSYFVDVVHRSGMRLGVWTPNEADAIRQLAELGIDWIITDRPDLALRALENA